MTKNEILEMANAMCGLCKETCQECEEYTLLGDCDLIRRAEILGSKDYRKVERGEWIEGCDYNTCSRCGSEVARYDDGGYYQDFALCPHCGADMRKEIEK